MRIIFLPIILTVDFTVFSTVLADNVNRTIVVGAKASECFYRILKHSEVMKIQYKVLEPFNNKLIRFRLTGPENAGGTPPAKRRLAHSGDTSDNRTKFNVNRRRRRRDTPIKESKKQISNLTSLLVSSLDNKRRRKAAAAFSKLDNSSSDRSQNVLWLDRRRNAAAALNKRYVNSDSRTVMILDRRRDAAAYEIRADLTGEYRFCFINNFDSDNYKKIFFNLTTYMPPRKEVISSSKLRPSINLRKLQLKRFYKKLENKRKDEELESKAIYLIPSSFITTENPHTTAKYSYLLNFSSKDYPLQAASMKDFPYQSRYYNFNPATNLEDQSYSVSDSESRFNDLLDMYRRRYSSPLSTRKNI